ncbi:MAG: hypothetical protein ACRDTH_22405 [Pseudonocardiaceae bacterium]
MHTFEAEAAVLSHLGSLALRRFLVDTWAWLGGNREWHSTTGGTTARATCERYAPWPDKQKEVHHDHDHS